MADLLRNEKYLERVKQLAELELPWEKLAGKRVVISGATGMIGKMLIDALMCKNVKGGTGCEVIAIGRDKEKAKMRLGEYFGDDDFDFIEADVNDGGVEVGNVDYVLHLASATHPRQYAIEPISTIMANVVGLDNLLKVAAEKEKCRFLFASSVEIYGENRGDVGEFDEKYLGYIDCNTLRAGYPEGKRVGEALCQAYRTQYGLDFVTVRLARVFGPTMLISDSKASSQFVKNAMDGEDIVLKSKGEQEYSYLYVADAVKGILYVLLCGKSSEAYNVADEKFNVRLRDFAKECAEVAGRKVIYDLPSELEAEGFSKATKALMNSEKIRQLGFRVNSRFEECVRETIEILKEIS